MHDDHAAIFARQGVDDGRRPVGRTVVHHHQLPIGVRLRQHGTNGLGNVAFLVVDAHQHRKHGHEPYLAKQMGKQAAGGRLGDSL